MTALLPALARARVRGIQRGTLPTALLPRDLPAVWPRRVGDFAPVSEGDDAALHAVPRVGLQLIDDYAVRAPLCYVEGVVGGVEVRDVLDFCASHEFYLLLGG
jgi:hypothetical protein